VNAGEQREGHNGYACWYFPARGSGVFLRLGRTRLLYRKDKTQPGSGMSQLEDAWRKRLKLSVAMDSLQQMSVTRAWPRSNITRLKGSTGGGRAESFPLLAADLGYDSVLVLHNNMMSSAELVVTRRACMEYDRPLRACTPLLDVRTWARRHEAGSCACDDEQPTLNCEGVGS
jgi:hypothetical protein